MKDLVIQNKTGNYAEVLIDYDPDSFKYEYEINNERQISFTAFKVSGRTDIFDMLTNENYIIYNGQKFVIKSSSIQYDTQVVTNELICKHVFMEFQNHYVDKNVEDEELNTDEETEVETEYTLQTYLDFAFKNNPLGFTYEIVGDTSRLAVVPDGLGGVNGMEFIVQGAEYFGYVYFADNKHIYFYQPETFYKRANTPIIYRGNSDELQATIVTTDLKTIGLGYGKKKTKTETKNYNPIKSTNLKLTGTFNKDGTWYSSTTNASYEKTFECKWGGEDLIWTRKQASLGGMVDVYLDGEKIATYNQYRKTAKTTNVVIARGLEKGEHTFKVIRRGASSGVDYKGKAHRLYVGSEKTTVLNLVAKLKGSDVYYATTTYKSPNYEAFGHIQAPTIYSETATTTAQVEQEIKDAMNDEPTVELSTNYLGDTDDRNYIMADDIKENSLVRFIHKPLGFNVDLKIVKITIYHPSTQKPSEVEFSNSKQDIITIQNQINLRIKRANSAIANGNWQTETNIKSEFYSDVLGSVTVDD